VAIPSEHDDVTVVIPCFNYGRFLPEALNSVRAQEGGPPRILIVDDGSTDPETHAVLAAVARDVKVIWQTNGGISAARNAGFSEARTPLLLALDADDMLPGGALRALKRGLDADPSAGFSYGATRFIGEWSGVIAMPGWDPYRLLFRHTIGPTALTRRELFEDVGGYDPKISGYEDWEFWIHALAKGWHGVKVAEATFLYRRHGGTKLSADRSGYRRWYRAIRIKHAGLYRQQRALARESDLGALRRAVYRFYWGPRPVSAALEARLHGLLWGRLSRHRGR
jgi:glycosyltransferase involved in cell wall biosynthesis